MSFPAPLGSPATYVPPTIGPTNNVYTVVGQTVIKAKPGTVYGCLVTVTDGAANSAVIQILDGTNVVAPVVCPSGETRGFMITAGVSFQTSIILNVVTLPSGATLTIDIFYI